MTVYRNAGVDAENRSRSLHEMKCPGCGQWFDMRDLKQALAHLHDADVEICEGPTPPPLQ
jgi:hypothetical protein